MQRVYKRACIYGGLLSHGSMLSKVSTNILRRMLFVSIKSSFILAIFAIAYNCGSPQKMIEPRGEFINANTFEIEATGKPEPSKSSEVSRKSTACEAAQIAAEDYFLRRLSQTGSMSSGSSRAVKGLDVTEQTYDPETQVCYVRIQAQRRGLRQKMSR